STDRFSWQKARDAPARQHARRGGARLARRGRAENHTTGGDAHVLPTANPDQLMLFKQKQLDGVWTVEPWVSRLELEAQGRVLVEEWDVVTTVLVTGVKFLDTNRDLLRNFVAAHKELTEWIKANPAVSQRILREELAAETRTPLSAELVERAWKRIIVTSDISQQILDKFMSNAQSVGFLRGAPDLSRLVEKP